MRTYLAAALLLGVIYVFVTPPFAVPDESNHLWRGFAVSRGQLLARHGRARVAMAQPVLDFVYIFERVQPGETLPAKLRLARQLPYAPPGPKEVRYAAWYTPLPYVAQSLVAAMPLRPIVLFYAGRLANLFAALALIGLGMRAAPRFAGVIGAAALLPMTLYELASWSADAATIALAWLFTALLLEPDSRAGSREPGAGVETDSSGPRAAARGSRVWLTALAGFAAGLCKPVYFLIAALALVAKLRWRERIAVIAATLLGTLLAACAASRGAYNARADLPVDAGAQLRCILSDPLHFVRVLAGDAVTNGRFYVEEMIGRFGPNSVKLPPIAITLGIVMLVVAAIGSAARPAPRLRGTAIAIAAATAAGILLSQYLIWSIVCGDAIEGVQGRYFLEILPLVVVAAALPLRRWRYTQAALIAIAVVCNAVALRVLLTTYWP